MYTLHKKILGFTLVELVITMTIVAITSTLATVYFFQNFSDSRDAWRITDIDTISKNLDIFYTKRNVYPNPDKPRDVTYSGSVAWTQWVFWERVNHNIWVFGKDYPTDPLYDDIEYTYSITNNATEYQVGGMIENIQDVDAFDDIAWLVVPRAHASIPTAYVRWNYNELMVRIPVWDDFHYIASPSIITSDFSSPDIIDIITQTRLVYDQFYNIPEVYNGVLDTNGGFDFNVSDPVVFSGSTLELKTDQWIQDFSDNLKFIYAISPTESFDRYRFLSEDDTVSKLKNFLADVFRVRFKFFFNCKDILDNGKSIGDGNYIIDDDGSGANPPYEVYCDMTSEWWGWTRVWDNHLENGDFAGGLGVVGAIENDILNHQIVPLPAQLDGNNFALRQTGNYSSNYRIKFGDPTLLRQGYQLRMTMWRSDFGSGTWSNSTSDSDEVTILWWKSNPWTIGTCTNDSNNPWCKFVWFNRKLANTANFWPGWNLTNFFYSVVEPVSNVTTSYLDGEILFDWFTPSSGIDRFGTSTYSDSEKQAIDEWVQAWGFLISTNDEQDYDPLGEFYGVSTQEYNANGIAVTNGVRGEQRIVQDVDHPIVNGSIGLWIDLRWKLLTGPYRRSALDLNVWPEDIVIARENRAPFTPTVVLRRHGRGYLLITSGDGIFKDMANTPTFDTNDLETVLAANIMTFAIETAADINPYEWYVFHNRVHYDDGTFSTNGQVRTLATQVIDDGGEPRVWAREQVRHRIYKAPESFDWYLWLDANNNKDLYFTWLRLELFYR